MHCSEPASWALLWRAGWRKPIVVTVWNRNADKAEKLKPFGVGIADSPSAACNGADVAIVMLSNGPVVEEVLFSPDSSGRKPAETLRPGIPC